MHNAIKSISVFLSQKCTRAEMSEYITDQQTIIVSGELLYEKYKSNHRVAKALKDLRNNHLCHKNVFIEALRAIQQQRKMTNPVF